MVERAEEQCRVEGVVGDREFAGVAEPRGDGEPVLGEPGGRHVLGYDVEQLAPVSVGGEPGGVRAGAAADVEQVRGRPGQVAAQDLLGAGRLQPAGAGGDAVRLAEQAVVGEVSSGKSLTSSTLEEGRADPHLDFRPVPRSTRPAGDRLAPPGCQRTASTRAGTCLCHGVPAYGSRSSARVSSFGGAPVRTRSPEASG